MKKIKVGIITIILLMSLIVVITPVNADTVYLPTGVLEHTFQEGPLAASPYGGTTYNPATDTYWTLEGGSTPSNIYEYSPNGTILTSSTVPLDGRAIVYRPEDGNIYIRSYSAGLYRLTLPFDGTVTLAHPNIFQDAQCGFAFANGGNIFDVYNGSVREYNFATGNVVRTFLLNPNYPSGGTYPYNCQIGSDGSDLYFFSAVDDVYVYDNNGNYKAIVDLNHPSFDSFYSPFSLSYTVNERIYIRDPDTFVYGYRIKKAPVEQVFANPIAAFIPVKNYHLRQVNTCLECIEEHLPEDIPGDVQTLLDEMQEHIDNANTTGNTIYANNELLKAKKCCEDIQEKLGITCS